VSKEGPSSPSVSARRMVSWGSAWHRPNGLEMSRPPSGAPAASLYGTLAGGGSVHFRHVGGSAPSSC